MPSSRVSGPTVLLSMFDVVAKDGNSVNLISHTGLAKFGGEQDISKVAIVDMGPPLYGPSASRHFAIQAIGMAELTNDEIQKIRIFVDRHASEHQVFAVLDGRQVVNLAPRMYCIHPHASPLHEDDGRYARTRFSCAGFVFEAYRKAKITLLDVNELPEADRAAIDLAYAQHIRLITQANVTLADLGLSGTGPWRVMFCGYLLHALNRTASDIRTGPYNPILSDSFYA